MTSIGALSVSIEGGTQGFERAMDRAQGKMRSFGDMAGVVARRVALVSVAAAGAAAAFSGKMVLSVANAADE
ncbi:hypothetical protein RZS08_33950, partial [Arthrospira platensis SPKY1]|nr:hypothetical protein [Arthrospira platensis SPKY1]